MLDGATGTELERRGVRCPAPLWSAAALLDAPEVIMAIHSDYVAAGAHIIIANTFRTNPRTLRAAGLDGRGPELNRRALELARQSAAASYRDVFVAASVAPVEDCYSPELVPDEAELYSEHTQMADWLAVTGVELVWIETMGTVREARAAAQAAAEHDLPFVVSWLVREAGELLGGESLEDAIAALEPLNPLAFGLNCIPPRGVSEFLPRLRRATPRPLAAYAHINNRTPIEGWSYAESPSPAEYGAYAAGWLRLGATIVGGCCGTRPEHIRAVRAAASRH